MINIIPQDIKNIYINLLSPRKEKKDIDDILSDEGIDKALKIFVGQRSIKSQRFSSGEISLPIPLENIEFAVYSDGLTYNGNVKFSLKNYHENDKIFENISERIKSPQTQQNMDILKIDKSLLFMIGKTPYFAFVNEDVLSYLIFGSSGTVKRPLSSLEVFEQDIKNLAEITTNIVNAHYEGKTPDIDYELCLA